MYCATFSSLLLLLYFIQFSFAIISSFTKRLRVFVMLRIFFAMFAAHMASLDKDEDFFDSFARVKKRKLTKTSLQKCIISGEYRNEILLRKGRAVATLVSAVKRRKDKCF